MVTQEYQTQLINSVKEDIKHLHEKVHATQKQSNNQYLTFIQFNTQYRFSEAYHMSQMRDLPPIAG